MFMLSLIIVLLLPFMVIAMFWFGPARNNYGRFSKIALAFDCAGNSTLNGVWNETVSSRAGRKWPKFARFINWLFDDPKHCEKAVAFTESYLKNPEE